MSSARGNPSPATAEVILAAARRAIAARGPEKLSLSAVAAEAGVSRPTLYRWFPSKAILLTALAVYEVEQFDRGLRDEVGRRRGRRSRLDAALRYTLTYVDEQLGRGSVAADPEVALRSLADSLAPRVASLASLLDDALDEVPSVASGLLTREEAVEMFLRVAYSHYLVPHRDADLLLDLLRGFANLQPPAVRAAGRRRTLAGSGQAAGRRRRAIR